MIELPLEPAEATGPCAQMGALQPAAAAVSPEHMLDQLMARAFNRPRTLRSAEYRYGTRAYLEGKFFGRPTTSPFADGTPQADAYYAGIDEGRHIWQRHIDLEKTS